jgi:hypothetical protein
MKKLIRRFILRSLLRDEKGRMELQRMLQNAVGEEYREQTVPGNIYNNFIEFIMSNESLRKAVKDGDMKYVDMVNRGITKEYYQAINYINKEKMYGDGRCI